MPHVFIKLINAKNLLAADLNGSSDPYCIFKYKENSFKSKMIPHTLQPTWNESFEFDINDINHDIELQVFDYDTVGSHDSLGTASIPINNLIKGIEKTYWIKLIGGEMGENIVGMAVHATLGTIFGKSKKKKNAQDSKVHLNKGHVQISITAIDFGIDIPDSILFLIYIFIYIICYLFILKNKKDVPSLRKTKSLISSSKNNLTRLRQRNSQPKISSRKRTIMKSPRSISTS